MPKVLFFELENILIATQNQKERADYCIKAMQKNGKFSEVF